MPTVKQGMSHWPGNDGKMTSHSNFKVTFSKRPLHLVRGCLFQFSLIWEVLLSWVLIWLKIGHCKAWTGTTNQQAEMINSTNKSNDDVYSRVDTLKSNSNLNTLPFPRKSTEECQIARATREKWRHTTTWDWVLLKGLEVQVEVIFFNNH